MDGHKRQVMVSTLLGLCITLSCQGRKPSLGSDYVACLEKSYGRNLLIEATDTYDAQSLFDYIDGEADLFLEYGFQNLAVLDLKTDEGDRVHIELYLMGSPLDAMGIFSIRGAGQQRLTGPGAESRLDRPYLEFYRGDTFVSLRCEDGIDPVKIGSSVDQCLSQDLSSSELPAFFQAEPVIRNTVVVARGPLSSRFIQVPIETLRPLLGDRQDDFSFLVKADAETLDAFLFLYRSREEALESFTLMRGSLAEGMDTASSSFDIVADDRSWHLVWSSNKLLLIATPSQVDIRKVTRTILGQ